MGKPSPVSYLGITADIGARIILAPSFAISLDAGPARFPLEL